MGGPSGIPFSQVCAWMDERSVLSRDERDRVIHLVQRMDSYYLKWVHDQMKAETEGVRTKRAR